jgi:hypothetical protein
MSPLTNLWRQLVQRRLWPVAVLLIAALAAVPLTLAKQPDSSPAPAPVDTADDASSELATQPIVAMASASDRAKRRKVLGKSKNPFAKPAQLGGGEPDGPEPAGPDASEPDSGDSAPDKLADTINIGGGGGSATPSPTGPSVGAPPVGTPVAPPVEPKPVQHERHSLSVRFGEDDSLQRMNVKRLDPLPLGEEPLVVYLGVADHGDSAVFLVDTSVTAEGDGECVPDPNTCEEIHLREGETEFFDVVGENGESVGSYQLDLLEIHEGKDTSAKASKARASKSVRRVLRARASSRGASGARRSTVARSADVGLALP